MKKIDKKGSEIMRYAIIILLLGVFIYNNYIFKKIKRRIAIKKMKIDERISNIIDDFKKNMSNNAELKAIQNKMRIIQIVKCIFYLILIILPIIYIIYKINFKIENLIINEIYIVIYMFFLVLVIMFLELYTSKNYLKNEEILKEHIYSDFLKNLKYDIKWYNKYNQIDLKNVYEMFNTYINLEEIYQKANFNQIQFDDKDIYKNTLLSKTSWPKKVYFEDYITGIYKEKYIISLSDFKEKIIINNFIRRYRYEHIINSGIFCVIKIDKKIINNIKITNDKKDAIFFEKQYIITTMPKEFYKDFVILAEDGYEISKKISKKSIEIIKNFYDNSKIKFDISIKGDEIFFRFKTVDSMKLNIWRNIVDELMLKEYTNIIMFVTKLSEEINNNWK